MKINVLTYCLLFGIVFILTTSGCLNAPDLENTPAVTGVSLSKTRMVQGSLNNDSIVFEIQFTDGDGNFGSDKVANIFFEDGRDTSILYEFKAPVIPEQGTNNGVKGTIYLTFYTICCFTDVNPSCCLDNLGCPPENIFPFFVYLKDRDGNISNKFETQSIKLDCL